jgi:hypothetical protein
MKYADLVEILTRELGPDLASRACAALRREAAGEDVAIPRRDTAPVILPGDTPKSVQTRYGVSRRTAYRWVDRWR